MVIRSTRFYPRLRVVKLRFPETGHDAFLDPLRKSLSPRCWIQVRLVIYREDKRRLWMTSPPDAGRMLPAAWAQRQIVDEDHPQRSAARARAEKIRAMAAAMLDVFDSRANAVVESQISLLHPDDPAAQTWREIGAVINDPVERLGLR